MSDIQGLNLLKQLMSSAITESRPLYAPNRLRFGLEVAPNGYSEEVLRKRLEELLGSADFALEPLFDRVEKVESRFYVFSPSGVDRTLPADLLFDISEVLKNNLELISCEPDTGARVFSEPAAEDRALTESAALEWTCWVKGEAPQDRQWALKQTKVPQAWNIATKKGAGIVVAQIDTGIAEHEEIDATTFDLARSVNLVEGGTDPTDPLSPDMSSPGHGTATCSVLAGDEGGELVGSAPGVTHVPIRCINDVKVFDALPVARAINHAVTQGAHIISMSLGGVWHRSLRQAVRNALRADVLVLAAAGNCVRLVVWPARYQEVIAVGGNNHDMKKWRGSSIGKAVDFSGPAEMVPRAKRTPGDISKDLVEPSQGTSYAVALSAGIAALWLDHWERRKLIVEARRRGVTLQDLFREEVKQTAHRPSGFHKGLGAGVIDAEALLSRNPLSGAFHETPASPPEDPSGGLQDALAEVMGPGTDDLDFDWAAHGAELSSLILADARAGREPDGPAAEARAFQFTSPALARAADASSDPRIRALTTRGDMPSPSVVIPTPVDEERKANIIKSFGAIANPGLSPESAATLSPDDGLNILSSVGVDEALRPLTRRVQTDGSDAYNDLVEDLQRDLSALSQDGVNAALDESATVRLEALVSIVDRPAIAVNDTEMEDGSVRQSMDVNNPEFGRFAALASLALPDLEAKVFPAVGRIDGAGVHLGTGFVVAPGLIMTNRHVLEEIAAPLPKATSPARWQITRDATIDFSPSGHDPKRRFVIEEVVFAGADPIRLWPVSFDKLDLALLRVETQNSVGTALPNPIEVSRDASWRMGTPSLYVLGYPAPPGFIPRDEHGRFRQDVLNRLRTLFRLNYRRKYFSPGSITGQSHSWVFDHDATSLGGNSGSPTGILGGNLQAVGLHFAGDWLRANYAHDLNVVLQKEPDLAALLP